MTVFGYARVSTEDQSLAMQIDALNKYGVPDDRIFSEHESGRRDDRPQLERMLETVSAGDKVVIWKLDRLGRSLSGLVNLVDDLGRRGVDLVSLNDQIDTSTASGRLVFHVMASLAEFEADMTRERTRAGLAAARRRGKRVGRPPVPSDKVEAVDILRRGGLGVRDACARVGVSVSAYYRNRSNVAAPAA